MSVPLCRKKPPPDGLAFRVEHHPGATLGEWLVVGFRPGRLWEDDWTTAPFVSPFSDETEARTYARRYGGTIA